MVTEQPSNTDKKTPRNVKWPTANDATLVATLREQQAGLIVGGRLVFGLVLLKLLRAVKLKVAEEQQKNQKDAVTTGAWYGLKNNCLIVQKLRGLSGFGWDDSRCLVVAPSDVWERYIKDHPDAEIWRTKSFPLFDDIISLIEGRFAMGDGALHIPEEDHDDLNTETDNELDHQIVADWGADDSFDTNRTIVVTPPASQSRVSKHESPGTPSPDLGRSAKKRSRVTGPTAVLDVADALCSVANSVTALDSAPATQSDLARTPERRSWAVKMISAETTLTKDQHVAAVKLFARSIAAADTYMAIDDQELRNGYILAEI
ncbi:hypothetical protein BJ138DRAFT_1184362 [Hygrophoropsis aurantiaca]|uniref:Uncharacterized protein n=1 Tax=Hygrophoropsis aurantiaca TaxID=72124 RepID=A0ACB7ZSP9_9AGAM|nr:hypothetical protein BJ138DRAFT_1184362 [Hygrophoropsis aurantiaca]